MDLTGDRASTTNQEGVWSGCSAGVGPLPLVPQCLMAQVAGLWGSGAHSALRALKGAAGITMSSQGH